MSPPRVTDVIRGGGNHFNTNRNNDQSSDFVPLSRPRRRNDNSACLTVF